MIELILGMSYTSGWVPMSYEDMEVAVMVMKRRCNGIVADSYFDRHGNYIVQIMYEDPDMGYGSFFLKDTEPDNNIDRNTEV